MGWRRNHRSNPENCSHSGAITVRSTGIERIVCETCGHVSFGFETAANEEFQRDVFARQADDTQTINAPNGNHLVTVTS